jgi:tRNA threonylcarbamoyl adenosine modification protein YeaZ
MGCRRRDTSREAAAPVTADPPPLAVPDGPVLVIDTASNRGLVGLVEGDALLAERAWTVTTTYSMELLAEVTALLAATGVALEELTGIVVDVGPGGYGSLRVGVATAQGLALGLEVPLAGVARLEADAVRHLEGGAPVVAVHSAGAAGLAWAAYEQLAGAEGVREISEPRLSSIAECIAAAPAAAVWCGDITEELRAAFDASGAGGGRWTETPPEQNMRRALDLARLAREHGAYRDPAYVDVLYLRPPSITRARE